MLNVAAARQNAAVLYLTMVLQYSVLLAADVDQYLVPFLTSDGFGRVIVVASSWFSERATQSRAL